MEWDNLRVFLELARTERLMEAAQRLDVSTSTISRRLRRLEAELGTQLFDRNSQGFALTLQGEKLLHYAQEAEGVLSAAADAVFGRNESLSGQVRIGATEGFGCFVLAPHLAHFCAHHPRITVDLLPMPRFVSLSKREADAAVTIERPVHGSYVVSKLSDYKLKLYATADYLRAHAPIRTPADLAQHPFISYVDDLVFSAELKYLRQVAPSVQAVFRSTSVVAQYAAVCRGRGLGILPCFLAQHSSDLVPVLDDTVTVLRTFWLVVPADRRNVARVRAVCAWLRDTVQSNRDFLMGDAAQMTYMA
ncbi:MAG: LysR family transcriptional regulator [Proteobacteria bacterium]|nr:LysR family transcriptional regulator [Pseudomonadota bacterium]